MPITYSQLIAGYEIAREFLRTIEGLDNALTGAMARASGEADLRSRIAEILNSKTYAPDPNLIGEVRLQLLDYERRKKKLQAGRQAQARFHARRGEGLARQYAPRQELSFAPEQPATVHPGLASYLNYGKDHDDAPPMGESDSDAPRPARVATVETIAPDPNAKDGLDF